MFYAQGHKGDGFDNVHRCGHIHLPHSNPSNLHNTENLLKSLGKPLALECISTTTIQWHEMTTSLLKGPVSLTDGLECIELFMLPEEVEEVKVNIFNGEHVKNEQKNCNGS